MRTHQPVSTLGAGPAVCLLTHVLSLGAAFLMGWVKVYVRTKDLSFTALNFFFLAQ